MKKYLLLLFAILLAGCGSQNTIASNNLPESTNTLVPTDPPILTDTIQPTNTAVLPTATSTQEPTITPAYDPGTVMINPIDGASMAYIPPGEFTMGNDSGEYDEKPAHLVFTDGYWIYQYEVTYAQYAQCLSVGECEEPFLVEYLTNSEYDNYPITYISRFDAEKYCVWAGARLPTEAEWEKAARGGLEGMLYPWGNQEPVCEIGAENGAYFSDCHEGLGELSLPVGSFAPNGYGLYDMAGNVREWVNDYYKEDYYAQQEYDNPQGPWGGTSNARGGGFRNPAEEITVSDRQWSFVNHMDHMIGLRCAITP